MGKKKNEFRRWVAVFCAALLLSGCAAMPPQNEMEARRETQAKEDLKTLEPPASINFEKPLTLEDAIKIGLCNNLELRVADFNREVANKETLVQKLRMLPGLNAEAGYERRDRLRKSDVYNWKLEKDVEDYTVSELKDGAKANLSLTWNIWTPHWPMSVRVRPKCRKPRWKNGVTGWHSSWLWILPKPIGRQPRWKTRWIMSMRLTKK
jgi:hypothetical protein